LDGGLFGASSPGGIAHDGAIGGGIADFFSPLGIKTSLTQAATGSGNQEGVDEGFNAAGPSRVAKGGKGGNLKKRNHGQFEEAYARKAQAEHIMKRVRAQQQRRVPAEENVSDDEEHFAKRESARMQRDIAKLNPITLGIERASAATANAHATTAAPPPRAAQSVYIKAPKGAPKTAAPLIELDATTTVVDAVTSTDFDDLAGMDDVVRQLREMVLLPLQYPDVFRHLGVSPPRGILFHGVPGTGKTLAARALAGACARHSPTPVTFFARKGADCLGKFVGEAERTLRLMFQEASTRAPAIIFLDELDALVPARGRGAGHQDQIHASVVSTLLTLMDGMADRGNVVVVASTNRPDDIDPALRRPGRFDREVYFGLPQMAQRESILRAHTRRWDPVPSAEVLKKLASVTDGYAGADLAALCTAAVMNAVKREAPQLLQHAEALADGKEEESNKHEFPSAFSISPVSPSIPDMIHVGQMDWDAALAAAPPPCSKRHAAQALAGDSLRPMSYHTVPLLLPLLKNMLKTIGNSALPLPLAVRQAIKATNAAETITAATASTAALTSAEASLESALAALGAIQRAPDHILDINNRNALPATPPGADVAAPGAQPTTTASNQHSTGVHPIGNSFPPLRLLISGTDDCGQDQIAGAVLRLIGGSHVSVLSLPAIVTEGAGDAAQGVVALGHAALQRADRHSTLAFHLPHVEAWAVAPDIVVVVEEQNGDHKELDTTTLDTSPNAKGGTALSIAKSTPLPTNGALSPTSPSFAGLSARSLRMHASNPTTAHRPSTLSINEKEQGNNHIQENVGSSLSMPASDAWIAFESFIQEAAPRQPIFILATTSSPKDVLPSNLINGFESSGGVLCVDSTWDGIETKADVCTEAMERVQQRAKSAFAGHAADAFLEELEESKKQKKEDSFSSKEEKIQGTGTASKPDILGSTNTIKTATVAPPSPIPTTTTTTSAAVSIDDAHIDLVAKKKALNLNTCEWQKAQELFTSVQRFLVALGATLAKDRRCRAAEATSFSLKKEKSSSSAAAAAPEHVSFYSLALAAAQGRYLSLEQFQGAIARAVGFISKAAEEESRTGVELLHHGDAVALSFSIQDQIASACHALRTSLELNDPVNAKLLRAATGFAADVAIVYQQKEANAEVEAMRAAKRAEEDAQAAAAAAAAAVTIEHDIEGRKEQEGIYEMDAEAMMDVEEGIHEQNVAIEKVQIPEKSPATSPEPIPGNQSEAKVENEEKFTSTPIVESLKELEEQLEVPASSSPLNSWAAALARAAAQIKTDLLERVQFTSNSLTVLNPQSASDENIKYSCAWRAVNEALPVLVIKGMAACDAALKTIISTAPVLSNEDDLAELCREFVDTLISNLNE